MAEPDKYLVQLRRELTRSQARLSRAERQCDRLMAENALLRRRLSEAPARRRTKPAKKPAAK
jgi:hypothetical protein